MKILWIDPMNTDPQFLNMMTHALAKTGNQVIVRSTRRELFDPPDTVSWSQFHIFYKSFSTLENKFILKLKFFLSYPLSWINAAKFAKSLDIRAVIISTNLVLPLFDLFGITLLFFFNIRSIIIIHKPYYGFPNKITLWSRYILRAFYNKISSLVVMTEYTKNLLMKLFEVPANQFTIIPHPHFNDIICRFNLSLDTYNRLSSWASGSSVIGYISRPDSERGFQTFLNSLPELKKRIPTAKFLIISRFSDLEKVKAVNDYLLYSQLYSDCFFNHRFSFRKLRYLFDPCIFLNFQSAPCVHKNHISILCKITSYNYREFRTTFLKILFIEICPSHHLYSNDGSPCIIWLP